MRVDELRSALAECAEQVSDVGVRERLDDVDRRVGSARRRRRASTISGLALAGVAAMTAIIVVPALVDGGAGGPDRVGPSPDSSYDMVQPPPLLVGVQLPTSFEVNDVKYQYYRSEQSAPGRDLLRVAVAPDRQPQAIGWIASGDGSGDVVVFVDGNVVSREATGELHKGLLLSARRVHLVVVRAAETSSTTRLGLAIYRWPKP